MKIITKTSGKWDASYDAYRKVRKVPIPQGSTHIPENIKDHNRKIKPQEDNYGLSALKEEATIICELKGHKLSIWQNDKKGGSINECEKCHQEVYVTEKPFEDLDISGTAVNNNCKEIL